MAVVDRDTKEVRMGDEGRLRTRRTDVDDVRDAIRLHTQSQEVKGRLNKYTCSFSGRRIGSGQTTWNKSQGMIYINI